MMPLPKTRRSLRLSSYDYTQPGYYFITAVSYQRTLLFADRLIAAIIQGAWDAIPAHFQKTALDEFVIMPNHIHGILAIMDAKLEADGATIRHPSLSQIVAYFKYQAAKNINIHRQTPGLPVWQRNYYERVIRSEIELGEVRRYVQENPIKWELDPENPINWSKKRRWGEETSPLPVESWQIRTFAPFGRGEVSSPSPRPPIGQTPRLLRLH
jgi:REP element-mobilizing transposase RayT